MASAGGVAGVRATLDLGSKSSKCVQPPSSRKSARPDQHLQFRPSPTFAEAAQTEMSRPAVEVHFLPRPATAHHFSGFPVRGSPDRALTTYRDLSRHARLRAFFRKPIPFNITYPAAEGPPVAEVHMVDGGVHTDALRLIFSLLLIRVSPRGREVSAQLLSHAARAVPGSVALDAPAFF